jgi:hypothetical protein
MENGLKFSTVWFLAAQVLDFFTTIVDLAMGAVEKSPFKEGMGWGGYILLRIFILIVGTIGCQKIKPGVFGWILLMFLMGAPVWNFIQIVLYLLH